MSITLQVHFKVPIAAVGGTYDLIGSVTSFTTPFDGNTSNDIAVIGTVRAYDDPDNISKRPAVYLLDLNNIGSAAVYKKG